MEQEKHNHTIRAFRSSAISIVLFVLNIVWLSVSIGNFNISTKVRGTVSAFIIIPFLVFNFKGVIGTYKSLKLKESFSIIQKLAIGLNLLLALIPILLILLVVLEIIGVDIWGAGAGIN